MSKRAYISKVSKNGTVRRTLKDGSTGKALFGPASETRLAKWAKNNGYYFAY